MTPTILALVTLLTASTVADAAVLCASKKGAVFVRDACKKKERAIDPVALGLQGPPGLQGQQGPKGDPGLPAWERPCPPDSVRSGDICMDTYEASVWRIPPSATTLVQAARNGTATLADLVAGGATPLGVTGDTYAPCADSGQNCTDDIYAVSLPGVLPSANITWFQAQAACENARKRLPSNAEWQAAVIGTPDPGGDNEATDCNTFGPPYAVTVTGSRSNCVSARGAFDMVGNLSEWVADWVPRSGVCGTWDVGVSPTGDDQCLVGAAATGEPGALLRGGIFNDGTDAGPLTVGGDYGPSLYSGASGFRCAR